MGLREDHGAALAEAVALERTTDLGKCFYDAGHPPDAPRAGLPPRHSAHGATSPRAVRRRVQTQCTS